MQNIEEKEINKKISVKLILSIILLTLGFYVFFKVWTSSAWSDGAKAVFLFYGSILLIFISGFMFIINIGKLILIFIAKLSPKMFKILLVFFAMILSFFIFYRMFQIYLLN